MPYPDSFDAISPKYEQSGFNSLSEKEQLIYVVWWLEAEVNNGGFHQYFWNSAGDYANEALVALEKIGAVTTAKLLKSAMETSFGGPAPKDRLKRQDLLEENEDEKMDQLDELDTEFYNYTDSITDLVNQY